MNTDLDRQLTELFDALADDVPVVPVRPFDPTGSIRRAASERVPGRKLLVRAAAAVVVLGGSVAVTATLTRDADPERSSPVAPASSSVVSSDQSGLFDDPAEEIQWSVITPDSTIAQARISSIAAGPGGFVAVGVGFDGDLTAGQGRAWFSADGVTWTELDHERFAPQGIYKVAASSDAYYLYARPMPATEGSPQKPAQLYRSVNGTDWSPVGDPTYDAGHLAAAGDVLLRVGTQAGGVLTSTDAQTWTPSQMAFGHEESSTAWTFDDRIQEVGGNYYMRASTDSGVEGVWFSTDGRAWFPAPDPEVPGRITGTDRALVSVAQLGDDACHPPTSDASISESAAAAWECETSIAIELLPSGASAWARIGTGPPTSTPSIPGLAAFGNQLVAAVEGSDGAATIWLSDDGTTWVSSSVEVKPAGGSLVNGPQGFWVEAHTASTIVISVGSPGVGRLGHLIVGTIADAADG